MIGRIIQPKLYGIVFTLLLVTVPAFAGRIILKNGLILEGEVARIGTFAPESESPGQGGEQIVLVDDNLRRTYISINQIREVNDNAGSIETSIKIPNQNILKGGNPLASLGRVQNAGEPEYKWDPFGRRIIKILLQIKNGAEPQVVSIVQGITEITPSYYRVQTLHGGQHVLLDQRFATTGLDSGYLRQLLKRAINPKLPNDRLTIYRFFLEADRYGDAEKELASIVKDFPGLNLDQELVKIRNVKADRGLLELKRRREAGQHKFAKEILKHFPDKDIAGAMLQEVREILKKYEEIDERVQKTCEDLRGQLALVKDQAIQAKLKPMVEEICAELNSHTLGRISSFIQLIDDKTTAPPEKLALAVSGWLVGSASATDNLPVAMSLFDVRNLVQQYLVSEMRNERMDLVTKIRALEGGVPSLVAEILKHMKPPLDLPPTINDTEGFYQLQIPGKKHQQGVPYLVQLPPEYDPYRSYPAIVSLHGAGTSPGHQIDWWCGGLDKKKRRTGQAARHGYIVIAPAWAKAKQKKFGFTGREHTAVLDSLRDAARRFAIDTDRVYLSGHSMGGDAAWDIGLAHPDPWAGVIPIVATADSHKFNYNALYWRNARHVPFYFIGGELDSNKMAKNALQFDRYTRHVGFDTMIVNYQGRGHESFQDEIQHLFDWMKRQNRDFYPTLFNCKTIRSFDNYFWWVETELPQALICDPPNWPPKRIKTISISGKVHSTQNRTTVTVKSGRSPTTVWLSPELVDFAKPIRVKVDGFREVRDAQPDIAVMLEDARTRGDRINPFWARIDVP